MIAGKAGCIRRLQQLQPLLINLVQRRIAPIEMVKDAELNCCHLLPFLDVVCWTILLVPLRTTVRDDILSDSVISYIEMCRREGANLQQGMNFGLGGNHSVILMSVRPNAPYRDRLEDGGTTPIYEGHDQPKTSLCPNPKIVNQPGALPS